MTIPNEVKGGINRCMPATSLEEILMHNLKQKHGGIVEYTEQNGEVIAKICLSVGNFQFNLRNTLKQQLKIGELPFCSSMEQSQA